ncbi:hypothetical protein AKJ56_02230 [candidate division MSBL1 archaeon SCGC-AAA382N08]|uniref:Uncharacterized protein n=1 Tax=candidate division MSBL1 archaeon SCGC-AAA382N08 TaxID=1698285 RepID=A0A133VN40_9EURY|nr:hypothetical protein AKJ56_02230 [candidate division MSBL1 archaeon SCGC-AAA382N08]
MLQKIGFNFILVILSIIGVFISIYLFFSPSFTTSKGKDPISQVLKITPTANRLPTAGLSRISFELIDHQDLPYKNEEEEENLKNNFIYGVMTAYRENSGAKVAFFVLSFPNEKNAIKIIKNISKELTKTKIKTFPARKSKRAKRIQDPTAGVDLTFFQKRNYLALVLTTGVGNNGQEKSLPFAKKLVKRIEAE